MAEFTESNMKMSIRASEYRKLSIYKLLDILQRLKSEQPAPGFNYIEFRADAYNCDGMKMLGFFKKDCLSIIEQIEQWRQKTDIDFQESLEFELQATHKLKPSEEGVNVFSDKIVDSMKLA